MTRGRSGKRCRRGIVDGDRGVLREGRGAPEEEGVGVGMRGGSDVAPDDFAALLVDVKERILAARTRAVLAVNAELVRLYWEVGRIIHERQRAEGWGAAVIPRLTSALKNELPEVKGFSERNIKRMLAFFREYPEMSGGGIVPPLVAQMTGRSSVPSRLISNPLCRRSRRASANWQRCRAGRG